MIKGDVFADPDAIAVAVFERADDADDDSLTMTLKYGENAVLSFEGKEAKEIWEILRESWGPPTPISRPAPMPLGTR